MIDLTGGVYTKKETKVSWLIRQCVVCDENQIGQRYDQSSTCSLHWKWNWFVVTNWIGCGLSWKIERKMTWLIVHVRSTLKTILNYHDWSNRVQSKIKTKQDNNVTDHIGLVHTENDIELSEPIKLGVVYDEIRQNNDVTNLIGSLRWKGNLTFVLGRTRFSLWWKLNRTTMWPIFHVRSTLKMKMSCCDWWDRVHFFMKNRKDNNMIDRTCVVHAKNDTQLLWPIGLCAICNKNQIR